MAKSIQQKIMLPTLVFIGATFIGLFLFNYISQRRVIRLGMESKVENVLFDFYNRAISTAKQNEFATDMQNKAYNNLIYKLREEVEKKVISNRNLETAIQLMDVFALSYVNSDGTIQYSSYDDYVGKKLSEDPNRKTYLAGLNRKGYTYSSSIFDDDGIKKDYVVSNSEGNGLIILTIRPENLNILLQATDNSILVKNMKVDNYAGYGFILDITGTFIYHPDTAYIGKNIEELKLPQKVVGETSSEFYYKLDNTSKFLAFRRGGGYYFGVSVDVEPYYEELNHTLIFEVIFSAICMIILGLTSTIIVHINVLKPLKMIRSKVWEISDGEGDLTHRLPKRSDDELGDLAKGFNTFMGTLAEIITEIKESSKQTGFIRDGLTASSEETAATIAEITANIGSIKGQIEFLDKHIGSTTEKVQSIRSEVDVLGAEIENQTASTEQASASINEMVSSLSNVANITAVKKKATEKLNMTTQEGGSKLEEMITMVREIHRNLGSISDMVGLINSIAAQTNLLAMNAAIEAAHAGDAGRGFAVVADEIRKLAENSGKNAKSISKELKEIASRIEVAATTSDSTRVAFDEIQKEVHGVDQALSEISSATEELNVGGKEILNAMITLAEVSDKVKTASHIIVDDTKTIGSAMTDISRISSEVSGSMDEIQAGSSEIKSGVNHLNNLSQNLNETTSTLESHVGQFRTETKDTDKETPHGEVFKPDEEELPSENDFEDETGVTSEDDQ
ncbi:methyl-accepting chemotaxis protein [Spirochaeta cellobiosiphila]|uniref:methyl-accepting chemotaxis protein n=1 Tax=Spirochaeta cellobiosiphila TaxID=504483 RepID=UPI000410A732|nr:methyl-accepting chemotaxis protein [Spirochaeta cellobiosiphila]